MIKRCLALLAALLLSVMFYVLLSTSLLGGTCLPSCTEADRVSQNISMEAENFNLIRRISVINMRSDKPIFELIGQFSISNTRSGELVVICEVAPDQYKKHYIYLNEWTMYVVEDISGADVSPYRYEINFLPEMIVPIDVVNRR